MRLRAEDWLPQAKRLAVGMQVRTYHGAERRANLSIRNDPDAWRGYCHACHAGSVVQKEHMYYTASEPPRGPQELLLPEDRVQVLGSFHEVPVGRFLLSKGIDLTMVPHVEFSPGWKRVLFDTGWGYMGRDITGRSPQKWITYNKQHHLGEALAGSTAVVVEDTLSWYKLRWALPGRYSVLCSLGTSQHPALKLALVGARAVLFMYDGDRAGERGAAQGVRAMRGLGVPAIAGLAPEGLDPKDLDAAEILKHVEEACRTL